MILLECDICYTRGESLEMRLAIGYSRDSSILHVAVHMG